MMNVHPHDWRQLVAHVPADAVNLSPAAEE